LLYDLEQAVLLVPRKTGVVYRNQTHGTCCCQDELEGFIVPLSDLALTESLEALFPSGCYGNIDRATGEKIQDLLQADRRAEGIRIDWDRFEDSYEAWLHVRINDTGLSAWQGLEDHEGILTWPNSD